MISDNSKILYHFICFVCMPTMPTYQFQSHRQTTAFTQSCGNYGRTTLTPKLWTENSMASRSSSSDFLRSSALKRAGAPSNPDDYGSLAAGRMRLIISTYQMHIKHHEMLASSLVIRWTHSTISKPISQCHLFVDDVLNDACVRQIHNDDWCFLLLAVASNM